MKILIVDDDALVFRALNRVLSRAGHQVLGAADHTTASCMAESGWADVALVDVDMPDGSGVELAKRFPSSLPVVFHTGNPDAVPRGRYVVAKPASAERIAAALVGALETA